MAALSFAVSVGHRAAAEIATDVLEAGGNAVDAGVAASIALTVLHSEQVQLGGIAPMIIRMSAQGRTYTIDGVGRWPAKADRLMFENAHRGRIPSGILRTVVPGAPDAWLTALTRFGTMGFAELAQPAMRLARDGFAAHEDLVSVTTKFEKSYRQNPGNACIWLPNDQLLQLGEHFVQIDLGATLQRLIEADQSGAAKAGRLEGLRAVRDLFYLGELAQEMAHHAQTLKGWLTLDDLASHAASVEDATATRVMGGLLHTCGPWSQGPSLSQALLIYEQYGKLHPRGGEGPKIHALVEAINLAMADREAYYGDPDFVTVPLETLLSPEYAACRAELIDAYQAFGAMPPGGLIDRSLSQQPRRSVEDVALPSLDTSVAAIIDNEGNVFVCTPSDSSTDAPVVPGLGFVLSTRGSQSQTIEGHPSALAPGKRPRVTACPMLFESDDGRMIAGGGPGGDLQLQAMAQVLVHHLAEHQSLADATAKPRFFSLSAPTSNSPHLAFPGRLVLEEAIPESVMSGLAALGHKTVRGDGSGVNQPSVCLVALGPDDRYEAVADPRRRSGQSMRTTAS